MKFQIGDIIKRRRGRMVYKILDIGQFQYGEYLLHNITNDKKYITILKKKENWILCERPKSFKIIKNIKKLKFV